MELVEETTHWQEGEMENEWESLALGPGWAPLLTASGQEEGKATGLPAGGPSCPWGVVQGSSLPGTHRSHRVRSSFPATPQPPLCLPHLHGSPAGLGSSNDDVVGGCLPRATPSTPWTHPAPKP